MLQTKTLIQLLRFSTLGICVLSFRCASSQQPPVNYSRFEQSPLGGIKIETPKPFEFSPVGYGGLSKNQNPQFQSSLPDAFNSPQGMNIQRNQMQMHQQIVNEMNRKQLAMAQMQKETEEDKAYLEYMAWMRKTQPYRDAYKILADMNPDSFSLTKAIFTVENAYYDNKYKFDGFERAMKERAEHVRQILKREGLSEKNNLAANYGIMKLYQKANNFYD